VLVVVEPRPEPKVEVPNADVVVLGVEPNCPKVLVAGVCVVEVVAPKGVVPKALVVGVVPLLPKLNGLEVVEGVVLG